ncbi:hypothetical protein BCO18430_06355 [Burkholderia contaminans]|nr:hypothetical protein BCO18430_06355 [Burkholderia contaminans]VWD55145.1 hypothetical protein BCO19218_06554 [Burkholderia contaminans]
MLRRKYVFATHVILEQSSAHNVLCRKLRKDEI